MVAVAGLGVVLNVAINPPRISALRGCHYLFLAGPCQFIEIPQMVPASTRRWGDIPPPSGEYASRAGSPCRGAFAYMIVMRLVVSGLLNKQVADERGITESTVKAERDVVMQKMKARARKRALSRPRWFERNPCNSFGMNGWDDETRTRDLCRDSFQRHGRARTAP